MPWIRHSEASLDQQRVIQELLGKRAGAKFGKDSFVAGDARVFTDRLWLGDRSWIASGAIVRGDVAIDADCSVNPYAHLAGRISIGRGCRIASLASISMGLHGLRLMETDRFRDQGVSQLKNATVMLNSLAVMLANLLYATHLNRRPCVGC